MRACRLVLFSFLFSLLVSGFAPGAAPARAADAPPGLDNAVCQSCHGITNFGVPDEQGKLRSLHVAAELFDQSVHGKRQCVECHQNITAIPHGKEGVRVSCISCHERIWDEALREGRTQEVQRMGNVVKQIERHMASIHARPNRADQRFTNATCYDCHNAHYVFPRGTAGHAEWRRQIPNTCGACHDAARHEYLQSVHAEEAVWRGNPRAAVCSDCHSGHDVQPTERTSTQIAVIQSCGACHREAFRTYTDTYHGQVTTLGFGYTAKCFDCHENHTITRISNPLSPVHPNNRLDTCRECHVAATAGFLTFQPHANTHDFRRYPHMWIASKFMIALLVGVFAFFWTHSALWFYREFSDRRMGRSAPHVNLAGLPHLPGKHYRRFRPIWRILHLIFAVAVMTLVLTGMALFYPHTNWAQNFMQALSGPQVSGLIHRVAAIIMLSIFFTHLVIVATRITMQRRTFQWFGPNSLVPRWKDLTDAIAMFKWFLGRGPRPLFDRWTYWEKFDYWAVFWGMAIIGGSGFMLWFPAVTASILPGWVLNVATLIHGEEAFLAAVFLFTVHFFNNHFRPDKYPPPDIVMFTGTVALEEFKREHTLEYQRLVESGELEKHLVDAPSQPMTVGSRILGLTLIGFGLTLLVLVIHGFIRTMMLA
jgi:cytochrome b subunit of formate dehydrogenase/ribosomal protein S27E